MYYKAYYDTPQYNGCAYYGTIDESPVGIDEIVGPDALSCEQIEFNEWRSIDFSMFEPFLVYPDLGSSFDAIVLAGTLGNGAEDVLFGDGLGSVTWDSWQNQI